MKIKLFNGTQQVINLDIKAGGYDSDTGKIALVVVGDGGKAGTISIDLAEGRLLNNILTLAPKAELVEAKTPTVTDTLK